MVYYEVAPGVQIPITQELGLTWCLNRFVLVAAGWLVGVLLLSESETVVTFVSQS